MPARTRGLIVGILLAAGAGSRFGGGKLLARLADDRGVAETACARLLPAVDRVVAVVPAQPGALEDALLEFPGNTFVISHDRWFLDRIATHILAFEGDSHVEFFQGNYREYEEDKKRRLGDDAGPHRLRFKALK